MRRIEVIVKQLVQKAMQGDLRAIREVTNMLALHSESWTPGEDITREQEMIQTVVAMMADMNKEPPLEATQIDNDEEDDECSNLIK